MDTLLSGSIPAWSKDNKMTVVDLPLNLFNYINPKSHKKISLEFEESIVDMARGRALWSPMMISSV